MCIILTYLYPKILFHSQVNIIESIFNLLPWLSFQPWCTEKIRHHNIYFFLILLKIKWFIIYSMLYTCKCNSLTWKRCFNNHNKKFELILYVRVYYPKVVVCCSLSIFFIYCFSPNQAIDILRMVFNIYLAANSIYPID